jgi:glycosyltransferase involved in cell wall biosynthesis
MTSKLHWTGIEIWEPYVKQFGLDRLYDVLCIEPALDALNKQYKALQASDKPLELLYDLIFIGDVLEHMPRSDAKGVLETCKRLLAPRGVLIVSVPIGLYPQDEYLGNPHEAHVDTWETAEELYNELNSIESIDWRFGSNATKVVQDNEIGVGFYTSENIIQLLAPKVAAYMICKDEEAFIGRCLESLEDADEVVVCDTGSSDRTIEIVQGFTENRDYHPEVILKQIAVSPWRFDDARNAALAYVDPGIDLCISIDADEMLVDDFILSIKSAWWDSLWTGKPFTRFNHSFMTHWNWDKPGEEPSISKHYHERVHARFGYHWVHPVHEKLIADNEYAGWCIDAMMLQNPDNTKSRAAYGPLLEQAVKEDPSDWKLWSFLSNERSQAGNIDGALEALQECEKLHGVDKIFIAWRRAALFEHVRKPREARRELEKAIELNGFLRESYVLMIELIQRNDSLDKSLLKVYANDALACNIQTQGYLRNEKVWSAEHEEQLKEMAFRS